MAVAVVLDFDGGTVEQYNEVIKAMGFTPGGAGAPGPLFPRVTETDVWESREQFERFAEDEIGPKSQAAGVPGPPKTTFHDVHNHLTAG
jgi:hypothetical protein